jgi:hypothetical protein
LTIACADRATLRHPGRRRPKSAVEHIPIHHEALGATLAQRKVNRFVVMRDPEGNGFCVE